MVEKQVKPLVGASGLNHSKEDALKDILGSSKATSCSAWGPHYPWLVHLLCDKDQQEQMPCLAGIPQQGRVAWQPQAFKEASVLVLDKLPKYLNSHSEHENPVSSWQFQI